MNKERKRKGGRRKQAKGKKEAERKNVYMDDRGKTERENKGNERKEVRKEKRR